MTIRGWVPPRTNGDDDEASPISQSCQMITFDLQSPEEPAHSYDSDCSQSSSSSTSGCFEVTPELPKPRKGDPKWVARPRNSFFIFRCEFIRDHSRGGRLAATAEPGAAEKTLSKRAGEAWGRLGEEQKNHYDQLALEEKKRHAEKHPDYRYRPVRGDKSRKGRTFDARTRHKSSGGVTKSRSSRRSRRRVRSDSPSPEGDSIFRSPLLQSPCPADSLLSSRRRSISVPPPSLLYAPFTPSQGPPFVPGIRRAISYQEPGISTEGHSPLSSFSSDQLMYPGGSSTPTDYAMSPMSGYISPVQLVGTSAYVSPLSAVSSSLANWNGEFDYPVAQETLPMGLSASMWSPEQFTGDPSSNGPSQLQSPAMPSQTVYPNTTLYTPNGIAMAHEFPHFIPPADCIRATPLANYTLDETARANALHAFDTGLAEHTEGDYLPFGISAAEEQRLFDGLVSFNN
ncbi:slightly ste11-like protein [Paramarasmius palmivorus]|uniref:Slightly ste11-like protein n=1 Tax=Paramarasmius palmivorus TaxID=297713 RepID=A0AAW0CCW1_9AGAR